MARIHFMLLGWLLFIGGVIGAGAAKSPWFLVPVFLGVLALVLRAAAVQRVLGHHAANEQHGPGREDIPADSVATEWLDGNAEAQAATFVRALLVPGSTFPRIKERVEPLTRAVQVEAMHSVALPGKVKGGRYWIPLIVERKGTLHDRLFLRGADGCELATLNFPQSVALVRDVLRRLASAQGAKAFKKYVDSVEEDLLALISRRAPATSETEKRASEVIGRLDGVLGGERKSPGGVVAVSIARKLVYEYAIVAELRVPDEVSEDQEYLTNIMIESRKILPLSDAEPTGTRGLRTRTSHYAQLISSLIGIRPARFIISTHGMIRAQSYHLEFMGPPGTYLGKQSLEGFDRSSATYARLRGRHGQRYAHLYIRNGSAHPSPRSLYLKLSFFERPPGAMGVATIAALSCAALVWTAGRVTAGTNNGDVVALMLAFPAAAASWTGFDRSVGPIGGDLVARVSSFATLGLSLAAATLYLKAWHGFPFFDSWTQMGTVGSWALLVSLACINAFAALYALVRRSSLYAVTLVRPVHNGTTSGQENEG